jgi:hypothetical protein
VSIALDVPLSPPESRYPRRMTDEEIEAHALELQQEVYPYGPPRASPPWDALHEDSREAWREKARRGVQPGQAAKEAEAIKQTRRS